MNSSPMAAHPVLRWMHGQHPCPHRSGGQCETRIRKNPQKRLTVRWRLSWRSTGPFEAAGTPALLSTMKGGFCCYECFQPFFFHSRDKPEELRRAQDTLGGSRFSFFFGGSTSGKPVNERTALQMTAVYSCVRILSEAVAGLPLHVYRYGENGSKVKALDHPLYRLLHDEPNPEMTSFNFRETLMGHLLLYGNAYRADHPQWQGRGDRPLSADAHQDDR